MIAPDDFNRAVRALGLVEKSRAVRGARLVLRHESYLDEAAAAVGIHKSGISRVCAAIKRHLLTTASHNTEQTPPTHQSGNLNQ